MKSQKIGKEIYQQHHLVSPIDCVASKAFFLSFTGHSRDSFDLEMQYFTLSFHVDLQSWIKKDKNNFDQHIAIDQLVKNLEAIFFPTELEIFSVSTPETFKKFTRRVNGCVGGVPHSYNNLLTLNHLPIVSDGFISAGDTFFPGQGMVSCAQMALNIDEYWS